MKHYAMKTYGGVDIKIRVFLTQALVGGQLHAPAILPPEERAPTHRIGGWVSSRPELILERYEQLCSPQDFIEVCSLVLQMNHLNELLHLFNVFHRGGWGGRDMWHEWGRRGTCIGYW
jgi:hypothetical protein